MRERERERERDWDEDQDRLIVPGEDGDRWCHAVENTKPISGSRAIEKDGCYGAQIAFARCASPNGLLHFPRGSNSENPIRKTRLILVGRFRVSVVGWGRFFVATGKVTVFSVKPNRERFSAHKTERTKTCGVDGQTCSRQTRFRRCLFRIHQLSTQLFDSFSIHIAKPRHGRQQRQWLVRRRLQRLLRLWPRENGG